MGSYTSVQELGERVASIRKALEPVFARDTAVDQISGPIPSAGHCAAVAALVNGLLGGGLVSAIVKGQSHWFNRFRVENSVVDVDITSDQFGFEAIRVADEGHLYEGTRDRDRTELHPETLARAAKLASRAGLRLSATDGNN